MPAPSHAEPNLTGPNGPPDWLGDIGTDLPVLPDLAARVIQVASDPDAGALKLSQIITKDQVLTTRLLGLANSASSAAACEITTLPEAIVRVGVMGVRNLAVTVAFASRRHDRKVYGAHGPALVEHGIGAAYLARLVAEDAAPPIDPDEAFLCGLLHDVGKLVMLKWYHDRGRWQDGRPIDEDTQQAVIAQWHPAAAGVAFARWSLPSELHEPVVYHHDYTRAARNRELAAAVYLANRLAHRYGFGCATDESDVLEDPVMQELGLTHEWLAITDERAPGLFSVARQVLAGA